MKMAFIKHLIQWKISLFLPAVFRLARVSSRTNYVNFFSTTSCLPKTLCSSTTIDQTIDNSTAKIVRQNSETVATIAKQVRECMKGELSQGEVIQNYSNAKKIGQLTENDFVRILVRLARSKDVSIKLDDKSINKLYSLLLEDIKNHKMSLKPFQIADVMWSLGKLGNYDADLFAVFGSLFESMSDFSDFSNADLAMILWAHGKASIHSPIVFSLIQKEVFIRDVETFTTRELCQIVWSFARVMRSSGKLFAAVRKVVQKRDIKQFNNQDIIMLLWAFSEGGLNVKPLFRYIKQDLLNSNRLTEYGPKDLSLIIWSYANQGIKAQDLFAEIERQLLTRTRLYLDDQSLVVVAWSFAHTDNKSPRLYRFIKEKLMVRNLSRWSSHRLVRVLWSFTKSGFLCDEILDKLTSAILKHGLGELSQNALEELVFTLQYCKLKLSPKLVANVEQELMKRAEVTTH